MKFNEIMGHKKQISFLTKTLNKNQLVHAYIFNGHSGIGKLLVASTLMASILCDSSDIEPCGECQSCKKIATDNHPDIMVIEPESGSVKNQQVEGFQKFVSIKPYESNHKIILIEDADTMTISAQNRILKILEEPPSYVIIIMLTTNINRLVPTIRSRCLAMNFQAVPVDMIASYIMDNYSIDESRSRVVANFSKGSFEAALKMLESEAFSEDRQCIQELFDSVIKRKKLKLFEFVSILEKSKEKSLELLDLLTFWIRDLIFIIEKSNKEVLVNQDKIDILENYVGEISLEQLYRCFKEVEKAKRAIREQVNLSANMEALIIALQEVRND